MLPDHVMEFLIGGGFMPTLPPIVSNTEFLAVSTADVDLIKRRLASHIKSLHSYLNSIPCLSDIQKARRRWTKTSETTPFGTFASDPYHCYTFHHGGRSEAQFNLGLWPTHLRVGLGFEFSQKKGGDPTVVQLVYACFLHVLRADQSAFEQFVRDSKLEIEWAAMDGGPVAFVETDRVVDWLLNPPREPIWIFVGRLLRRGADAGLLEDEVALGRMIQHVLCQFRPIWEEAQLMAKV